MRRERQPVERRSMCRAVPPPSLEADPRPRAACERARRLLDPGTDNLQFNAIEQATVVNDGNGATERGGIVQRVRIEHHRYRRPVRARWRQPAHECRGQRRPGSCAQQEHIGDGDAGGNEGIDLLDHALAGRHALASETAADERSAGGMSLAQARRCAAVWSARCWRRATSTRSAAAGARDSACRAASSGTTQSCGGEPSARAVVEGTGVAPRPEAANATRRHLAQPLGESCGRHAEQRHEAQLGRRRIARGNIDESRHEPSVIGAEELVARLERVVGGRDHAGDPTVLDDHNDGRRHGASVSSRPGSRARAFAITSLPPAAGRAARPRQKEERRPGRSDVSSEHRMACRHGRK